MTALRELITKIGFEVDDKTLDAVDKSVDNLREKLNGVKDNTKTFSSNISNFFSGIANNIKNVVSQNIGISNSFDKLSDSVKSDISGVTSYFDKLGISLYDAQGKVKSFEKIYLETVRKINNIQDKGLRSSLGQEILGDNYFKISSGLGKQNIFSGLREGLTKFRDDFDASFAKMSNILNNFRKKIYSLRASFFKISAVFTGIFTTLSLFGLSAANSVKELNNLSRKTGENVNTLKEFELLAQQAGLKTNTFSNSLVNFKEKLNDARNSSKSASTQLQNLGISLKDNKGNAKSTIDLYTEAARKLNNITDESKKAKLAQDLFGDSGLELTEILGQSAEVLAKQRKEAEALSYTISSKAIKASREYNKSWVNFKNIVSNVKMEIGLALLPSLTKINDKLKDWYLLNREVIHQNIGDFFSKIGKAIVFVSSVISGLLIIFNNIINSLGGFENILIIVSTLLAARLIPTLIALAPAILAAAGSFGKLAVAMLANPFTWLIGGIILLISELYHWVQGNDTVIGMVLGSWDNFKKRMTNIFDYVKNYAIETIESMKNIFSNFNPIGSIKSKLGNFFDSIRQNTIFRTTEEPKNVKSLNLRKSYKDEINDLKDNISPKNIMGLSPILEPRLTPSFPATRTNSLSSKIVNNINENITINVPNGTTEEQSRVISEQVTDIIQEQFNYNILRALDSLGSS